MLTVKKLFYLSLCHSLVQQLHPQLEREDIGLYLQQGSPPVSCSAGFSGIIAIRKSFSLLVNSEYFVCLTREKILQD